MTVQMAHLQETTVESTLLTRGEGVVSTTLTQSDEHVAQTYHLARAAERAQHAPAAIDWALEASYWGSDAAEWAESVWPLGAEVMLDES